MTGECVSAVVIDSYGVERRFVISTATLPLDRDGRGSAFGQGSNPRLWLGLVAAQHPYPGEVFGCAALTTSNLLATDEVGDAWITGRNPDRTSYCSPWGIGLIKHCAVANPQGCITVAFTDRIIERCKAILDGSEELFL